jgi:hypothetical protein
VLHRSRVDGETRWPTPSKIDYTAERRAELGDLHVFRMVDKFLADPNRRRILDANDDAELLIVTPLGCFQPCE